MSNSIIFERVKNLCDERGLSVTTLITEVTGSAGNAPTWKKGHIRPDYLLSVCNRLNVSADYLLKGKETSPANKNDSMDPYERREVKRGIKQYFDSISTRSNTDYFEAHGISPEMLDQYAHGKEVPSHKVFWIMMGVFAPFAEAPTDCFKALAILAYVEDRERKSDNEKATAAFVQFSEMVDELNDSDHTIK